MVSVVPDSDTAVTCPMVQTHLVQCQGGVFLSQRGCQLLQVLRLLHVILQRFVEADILLEHGARRIVQLPITVSTKTARKSKARHVFALNYTTKGHFWATFPELQRKRG